MAKMTPIVQGDTLVYQQQGHEQVLVVGTPDWYAWLATASIFAFASDISTFTVRKERAGNKRGGWYWKAYRMQHGKLSSIYLGKSEALTLERSGQDAGTCIWHCGRGRRTSGHGVSCENECTGRPTARHQALCSATALAARAPFPAD